MPPSSWLGLALQIGFLRMSGRLLEALRIVPAMLWRHLGEQFAAAPDLASLRAMYRRRRTLFEHQGLACETLGFTGSANHDVAHSCGSFPMSSRAPPIGSDCCILHVAGCTSIN